MLSIVTRTYKRPKSLKVCRDSLAAQTSQDFEHIVIEDLVGIGIEETFTRLRTQEVNGDYVFILDDDNVITDSRFVENILLLAAERPDIIVCPAKIAEHGVLPDRWPPQPGHIDMMNVVVSRAVFDKHKKDFASHYAGDWFFIEACMDDNPVVARYPGQIGKTQYDWHSFGRPE